MSLSLYSGFAPYLLKSAKEAYLSASPQDKVEEVGFLSLLKSQNPRIEVLKLNTDAGHLKSVQVKAKRRLNVAHTDTSKSCDVTTTLPYYEKSVDLSSTRQVAVYLEDETLAKYVEDASKGIPVGDSKVAQEMYDNIKIAANALVEGINQDLYTLGVAALGVNKVTGSSATQSVNFPLNTTNNDLTAGMNKILADYKRNNFSGRPQIVGDGLMHNFMLQQASKGNDQSGLDTKIQARMADFFYDPYTTTALGSNQFIVYEPDAVGLVEYMEYSGFKGGVRPGASIFGTIVLPFGHNGGTIELDWQLKYYDCATTLTDEYYGTSLSVDKGFNMILSKRVGLWTIPNDAYRNGTDAYYGNRGSLRFTATNV